MKSSLMRKTTMRYVAGATAMAASLSLVACGGGGEKASGDFDGEVKVGDSAFPLRHHGHLRKHGG